MRESFGKDQSQFAIPLNNSAKNLKQVPKTRAPNVHTKAGAKWLQRIMSSAIGQLACRERSSDGITAASGG
jgi:hypothetical protein